MLEQIIEQTSSIKDKTSKDKDELPQRLPSIHSKYVTRRTTFGRIRVDLPSKSEHRQMIESIYKNYDPTSEQNRVFDARIWSFVDDDIDNNKHDIDFYGLINAHYRNFSFEKKLSSSSSSEEEEEEENKEELSDNYIDQIAFPELTTNKTQIKTKRIQSETIKELKNENMNPIDEQYFGTLKQIEYQSEQTEKSIPTKRIEMPPADELNYIDQLVFNSSPSIKSKKSMNERITKTQSISFSNKIRNLPSISILASESDQSSPVAKSVDASSSQTSSDDLLDINFQFRISSPTPKRTTKPVSDQNETSMSSYNPKLESMRSIKSKDYFDPPRHSSLDIQKQEIESAKDATQPAEHIREQLTKKSTDRDSLGYRTFENLIPTWWNMTKAEIVDILIKQICFIRRKC